MARISLCQRISCKTLKKQDHRAANLCEKRRFNGGPASYDAGPPLNRRFFPLPRCLLCCFCFVTPGLCIFLKPHAIPEALAGLTSSGEDSTLKQQASWVCPTWPITFYTSCLRWQHKNCSLSREY